MRHPPPADDESLLAALRDALGEARTVPAAFIRAGQELYTLRELDLELAQLAHDSAGDHPVGALRAAEIVEASIRDVTFESRSVVISLRLLPGSAQGQVIDVADGHAAGGPARAGGPDGPGTVEIRPAVGEPVTTTIGDEGWFTFDTVPRGRIQLLCRTARGVTVLTASITV